MMHSRHACAVEPSPTKKEKGKGKEEAAGPEEEPSCRDCGFLREGCVCEELAEAMDGGGKEREKEKESWTTVSRRRHGGRAKMYEVKIADRRRSPPSGPHRKGR